MWIELWASSEKYDVTNVIDRQFVKDIVDLLSSFILQVQYVPCNFTQVINLNYKIRNK